VRVDEYLAVLAEDGRRLVEAAGRVGLDAAVPTCPGWLVRDLLRHVGGVHRWAASFVATGRREPYPAEDEERQFFRVVPDGELLEWAWRGHADLAQALSAAEPATVCWAFLPAPSPLAFWARRQAHETAIHRADAEAATGLTPGWDPEFAIDGVEELLRGFLARRPERITADPPASVALAATDVEAAWTIELRPDGLRVIDGAHPATLTVTAPASDLYLLLWNRVGVDQLDAHGDPRVFDDWRGKATVTWS
jgi:uncharacterized protein (TIGR03083 family)